MTYDLSKYTLLPGFIDTHVHILWHFGKDGRFDNRGETPDDRINAGVENARVTVMNGFTTVQSVGEAADVDLRRKLESDRSLPGPRILTSVRQINERTGAQRGSSTAWPRPISSARRSARRRPPAPTSSSSSPRPASATAASRR